MTARLGLNVDGRHEGGRAPILWLLDHNVQIVRMVSSPHARRYAAECREAGIDVLAVIARESRRYVMPEAVLSQCGNEPDAIGESSWRLTPQAYRRLWTHIRRKYPKARLIAAGLATGDRRWSDVALAGLDGCEGIAAHPYGLSVDDARWGLQELKQRYGLPVWATEWHNDPAGDFATMLGEVCAAQFAFCWSSAMVSPFGVVDASGRVTDWGREWIRYARRAP